MTEKQKKKNKFQDVLKLMKELDDLCDGFLFSTAKNRSWKKIVTSRVFTNFLMFSIILATTMMVSNFKLSSIILSISLYVAALTEHSTIIITVVNKDKILPIFNLFERMYELAESDFDLMRKAVGDKINRVQRLTVLFVKYLKIFMYFDGIFAIFGNGIIGSFLLPDSIYPKYSLPSPYYLPFKDQESPLAFFVTLTWQGKCTWDLCIFVMFILGLVFTCMGHALVYLDIVVSFVQVINQELSKRDKNTKKPFDVKFWIKLIVDMTSEVNSVVEALRNIFTLPCLMLEIDTLSVIFIFGVVVFIVNQHFVFILAFMPLCVMTFFIVCFLNEHILDKYDEITFELYNLPWYDLPVKDKKLIVTALYTDKLQEGLSAGLNNINLEQFAKVMKAAYSYFLILKDLMLAAM